MINNTKSRNAAFIRWRGAVGGLALLAAGVIGSPAWAGPEAEVIVSSSEGDRLEQKADILFGPDTPGEAPVFTVDDSKPLQKILGFGATFQEAGMILLSDLKPAEQEDVLQSVFDPEKGAGFSAMVTYMGSTDLMSAGPYYTYADKVGDVALDSFTIERDLKPFGLATYIKRAQKYGSFALHSRLDYPPNWMMVDQRFEKGMILDPHYYEPLSRYYLKYIQAYREQGIDITHLSLFNEPGFYTKISYSEIGDIIRNYVGPLFKKEGITTKLQVADAPFRYWAHKLYPVILDNPETRQYISGMTYHSYDFLWGPEAKADGLRKIADLHARYPDLEIWMTEHCYHRDSIMAAKLGDMDIPRLDFEDGDFWGNEIANELEAGASAWSYFNLILDEKGGPEFVSPVHQYKENNVQQPVIVINRKEKKAHYTGLYYYLSHFAKYVRPGSVRLTTTGSAQGLRVLSFKRPDGKIVVQVMNSRAEKVKVNVAWGGELLPVEAPAISISTIIWPADGATTGS